MSITRVPLGALLSLPASLLLLVFFVWPILRIISLSFISRFPGAGELTLAKYGRLFADPFYRDVAVGTLGTVLAITLLAGLLGYPAAYYLIRSRSRYKHILFVAMVSPLLVSVVVRTLGWLMLLGTEGPISGLISRLPFFNEPVQLLFNRGAVIVGMTHVLLPFMILTIAGTLAGIDQRLEETASVLGAPPFQTFLNVTLPLSLPGVVAGSILVFSLALGAYLTPFFLGGGKVQLLAMLVYDETLVLIDWPQAAALSTLLLVGVLALLGAYLLSLRKLARVRA